MGKIIEAIIMTARGLVSFTDAEYTNTTSKYHFNGSTYFQQSSHEERTITPYKGYSGVDTKVDPKNGIKYNYDKVINFVSNFQSGFWVFFVCGK